MDYKKILMLAYFNTVKASYSYQEMCKLFGLTIERIEIILNELIDCKYIVLSEYYKISDKGKGILREYKLDDLDIFEIHEEEKIFVNNPINFDEIYIPKIFSEKIK